MQFDLRFDLNFAIEFLKVESRQIATTGCDTFKLQLRSAQLRRFADIVCTLEYDVLATVQDPRYERMPYSATSAVPPVESVSILDTKNMLLECLHTVKTTVTRAVLASAEPAVSTDVSVS